MYENKQNTFLIPFLKIFELKTTHLFFFVSFTVSSLLKFESKTPECQLTKIYTGRLRPEVQQVTLLYTIFERKVPLNSYIYYRT